MGKGETTRNAILEQALDLASQIGLEGLTIGALAAKAGMSKSGLYAHFQSKENLQCQLLDYAAERFANFVFRPIVQLPRGLPRLRALFDGWVDWDTAELSGGCVFIAAAADFDDRTGAVHDRLLLHQRNLCRNFGKTVQLCIDEGHFRQDTDVEQLVFELWGILLGYHHFSRLRLTKNAQAKASQAFEDLIRQLEAT